MNKDNASKSVFKSGLESIDGLTLQSASEVLDGHTGKGRLRRPCSGRRFVFEL